MANYNNTTCYVFENHEKMKVILGSILEYVKDEETFAKEWCELDVEKFYPKPENFSQKTKEEKTEWFNDNWGVVQDFSYKIFENHTVLWIEGRNSVQYKIFQKFSEYYNLPVYIEVLPDGGFDLYFIYNNPKKEFKFEIQMTCDYKSELPSSFINFQMMGIEENIFMAKEGINLKPIEEDGSVLWKQRKVREEEGKKNSQKKTVKEIFEEDGDPMAEAILELKKKENETL